jgi:hypothetical protein
MHRTPAFAPAIRAPALVAGCAVVPAEEESAPTFARLRAAAAVTARRRAVAQDLRSSTPAPDLRVLDNHTTEGAH